MKNFADQLCGKIAELNNPTVMGLDPKIDYIPQFIIDEAKECLANEHCITDEDFNKHNFFMF